jgi:hypothetical protein
MLAILSKKKDSIRVESVNTDATIEAPPDYIGINTKKYDRGNLLKERKDNLVFEFKEEDSEESEENKHVLGLRRELTGKKEPKDVNSK